MDACYNFVLQPSKEEVLFNNVDATYIIHLTTADNSNERHDNIMKQLNANSPSKNIYILENLGFRGCKKDDYIQSAASDLTACFVTVFKHALSMGYNTVWVAEDDYNTDYRIQCKTVRNDIDTFIKDNYYEALNLGCSPKILIPATLNGKFWWCYGSGFTQSVIYSKALMEKVVDQDRSKMYHFDHVIRWNIHYYTYYIPIVYQFSGITTNSKEWNPTFDITQNKDFFNDRSYHHLFMQYKMAKLRFLFVIIYVLYIIYFIKVTQ